MVAALVDAHAFTLAETGAGGAGDTGHPVVLVLTRDPVPRAGGWRGRRTIAPGDQLQVLGAVRAFDLPRIEAEMGADLPDAAFAAWAARPAIVATALARPVGLGAADAGAGTPAPPTEARGRLPGPDQQRPGRALDRDAGRDEDGQRDHPQTQPSVTVSRRGLYPAWARAPCRISTSVPTGSKTTSTACARRSTWTRLAPTTSRSSASTEAWQPDQRIPGAESQRNSNPE